jgi:DNA-binding response OmpR family regulator
MTIESITVRLADEGVPLRAIARAVGSPSDIVREQLRDAVDQGTLLAIPKEDWPVGYPRDQRALQLARMVSSDRAAVTMAVQQRFHMPPAEAALLLTLVQGASMARLRLAMPGKAVDVHICKIRQRLAPHGIVIETVYGYGYQLSPSSRRKLMGMITAQIN